MRVAILFSLVAGSCAAAAPGPKDKDPPKPSPLVGEWELVSSTAGGNTRPWELGDRVFAFTADGKYADYGGGPKEEAKCWPYRADGKADPPTLDILDHPRGKGGPLRWLYKLDGDTLNVCLNLDDDTQRPAALEAGKASKNWILTFRRVKPKK
ncbi:MAG TPA: TIGR03067 domain-containing protein [Gemmataceae bacterium]|nr:TIGR03067 domain-containing protein [Gemmataceae bacterium]